MFAQTIVPGLLQRDHDTSIIYGSMDNGKTFNKNEKFNKLVIPQIFDMLLLSKHCLIVSLDGKMWTRIES